MKSRRSRWAPMSEQTTRLRAPSGSDAAAGDTPTPPPRRRRTTLRRIRRNWPMYLFIIPGMLWFGLFAYLPLLGNVVAFQDYSPFLGFQGSPWVGVQNFVALFSDPEFLSALWNTLYLAFLQIVFAFPAPIALALLLNSIISERVRRFIQTVVYLPHFLGWVIVVSIWQQVLSGTGPLSELIQAVGGSPLSIMSDPDLFGVLVTAQVIWKEVGWGTIIFLAAMVSIPDERYEAAAIDGAGTWARIRHVTLPGIASIIVLLLILRLGTVLTVGFEQLLIQQNAVGADAAQVLDTFVYFRGVLGGDWGFATAAGLFKGVVGTVMVIVFNRLAKRFTGSGVI